MPNKDTTIQKVRSLSMVILISRLVDLNPFFVLRNEVRLDYVEAHGASNAGHACRTSLRRTR